MGLLTPCSVPRGGFLYTMIVPRGGILLPSSRVPGVCPGGMVLDEINTCIITVTLTFKMELGIGPFQVSTSSPGDPRGFAHSSCFRVGVSLACVAQRFAQGGVLNQNKNSIISKNVPFLPCKKKQIAAFLHQLKMLQVGSVTVLEAQVISYQLQTIKYCHFV